MPPVHRRCLAQILDAPPKQHPTSTCFRRSRGDRHAGGNPVYNGVCLGPSSILYINRKYGFACIYSTPLPGMQMVGTLRFFFVQTWSRGFHHLESSMTSQWVLLSTPGSGAICHGHAHMKLCSNVGSRQVQSVFPALCGVGEIV